MILRPLPTKRAPLKAALFDFDGTISTLRQGWEGVMKPFMVEIISGGQEPNETFKEEVDRFIQESTGIQTIFQMQWLEEAVRRFGLNPVCHDAWWYKKEYNERLLRRVRRRLEQLASGEAETSDFIIGGAIEFIKALKVRGIHIFVASGTDHADIVQEAQALGVARYFDKIAGAPAGRAACSKEAVLKELIEEQRLSGSELLVVGDGKVEIALGVSVGAITLGVASDEVIRTGINVEKVPRLQKAGAHALVGDFLDCSGILEWLGVSFGAGL